MELPKNEPLSNSTDEAACRNDSPIADATNEEVVPERRSFFGRLSSVVMAFGMTLGYGLFGWTIGRFMYPNGGSNKQWQYVGRLADIARGESLTYVSPAGQRIVVTRLKADDHVGSFIAMSSVCPHLGCQVHWETAGNRFFCPCHNGAFDLIGQPLSGPPKTASQSLPRYPLEVKRGLLFIEVPTEGLV